MVELTDCFKYELPIKKLTKSNSIMVDDRVIYIVKKDHTGKASRFFFAYDYLTKIQLHFKDNKQELVDVLSKENFEVLK